MRYCRKDRREPGVCSRPSLMMYDPPVLFLHRYAASRSIKSIIPVRAMTSQAASGTFGNTSLFLSRTPCIFEMEALSCDHFQSSTNEPQEKEISREIFFNHPERDMMRAATEGGFGVNTSEHYQSDTLFFFDGKPVELSLYQALFERMEPAFPEASVKVQKSQISFYNKRLFAAASLPIRRRKDWPRECIIVTIGLSYRLVSPRVAMAVEPYPDRWAHHVLVSQEGQIDNELLGWLREAYAFAMVK